MYVEDMTLADARELLTWYLKLPNPDEQERWDIEDLRGRIAELS